MLDLRSWILNLGFWIADLGSGVGHGKYTGGARGEEGQEGDGEGSRAASFSCNAVRVESLLCVSGGTRGARVGAGQSRGVYDARLKSIDARAGASTCSDSCGIRFQQWKKGRW